MNQDPTPPDRPAAEPSPVAPAVPQAPTPDPNAPDPDTPKRRSLFAKVFRRRAAALAGDPESASPTEKAAARERMMDAADRFHLLRVDDVMVPRADIVAVEKTASLKELSKAFREAGHSRLPVFEDTLDNPVAMVHIKDLLPYLMFDARGRTAKTYPDRKVIRTIRRPVLYVPPSMLAQDLLRRMQARRIHMAIVVDEYGGTDGLVTIEDLIEPIVGDIEDEHDELDDVLKKTVLDGGKVCWDADARMSIDDFETAIGRDFASIDEEEEVDTLGGLVFTLAGRVPERGEIIVHPQGVEMEVTDADPRRVKRLRVTLPDPDGTPGLPLPIT
ncbi:MAG: CBS domain-containing protein [Litorimonas sp.]